MILGTISTWTNNGGVTVTIDGEEAPTTKKYMWLCSYLPQVGDRVLIEEIGGSYVILGKLTNDRTASAKALYITNNVNNHDNGYVSFGIKGGDLYFGLVPPDGGTYSLYKLQKA